MICQTNDLFGRSEVFYHFDVLNMWKDLCKLNDILRSCTSPRIDCLRIIPDNDQALKCMIRHQLFQDCCLKIVTILILVNHNMRKSIGFNHGIICEQIIEHLNLIIKVNEIVALAELFILFVKHENLCCRRYWDPTYFFQFFRINNPF